VPQIIYTLDGEPRKWLTDWMTRRPLDALELKWLLDNTDLKMREVPDWVLRTIPEAMA
jgi:hypothetical protein